MKLEVGKKIWEWQGSSSHVPDGLRVKAAKKFVP